MGAPFSFYDIDQNQNGKQDTNTDREIRKGFFSKFLVALIILTNIVFTILRYLYRTSHIDYGMVRFYNGGTMVPLHD